MWKSSAVNVEASSVNHFKNHNDLRWLENLKTLCFTSITVELQVQVAQVSYLLGH